MGYRLLADAVLIVHLAFIAFVVLGGLLVLRWPRIAWLHLPAVAWGAWIEFSGGICPLTPLEVGLRARGGEAAYSGGFIEHYVTGLIYPEGLDRSSAGRARRVRPGAERRHLCMAPVAAPQASAALIHRERPVDRSPAPG